jgi:hypothetical protein
MNGRHSVATVGNRRRWAFAEAASSVTGMPSYVRLCIGESTRASIQSWLAQTPAFRWPLRLAEEAFLSFRTVTGEPPAERTLRVTSRYR